MQLQRSLSKHPCSAQKSISSHWAQLCLCTPIWAHWGVDADKSCKLKRQLFLAMLCSDGAVREFNLGRGEMVQLCPFEVILLPAVTKP